ncbi:hypothetical protein [Vibrio panuliri]|uniref:Uncharacterized protein n=1 Tax=Vibrio panuliri TaxID=1381081 RepID=A0A1Q9HAX1_9VIBR|nr:hypothetical protein [Vibrio panuliri]KAB1457508.1 hypothetical protein F7O85_07140 [Vibrio panuliri]OLQ86287.1 hypothetical protein BIY22_11605 [Vibrio panuliri]OLQ95305.1 hypothetical protein BIY20_21255 [Vibrio panuliri]
MIVTNAFNQNLTEESKQNWLSYWKHFTDKPYCYCAEQNCTKQQQHGVLVTQPKMSSRTLYVVPLCKDHSNSFVSQLEIDDCAQIVPTELSL